jgi:hypothetical protein
MNCCSEHEEYFSSTEFTDDDDLGGDDDDLGGDDDARKEEIKFLPAFKLMVPCSKKLTRIDATDEGVWKIIILQKFNQPASIAPASTALNDDAYEADDESTLKQL